MHNMECRLFSFKWSPVLIFICFKLNSRSVFLITVCHFNWLLCHYWLTSTLSYRCLPGYSNFLFSKKKKSDIILLDISLCSVLSISKYFLIFGMGEKHGRGKMHLCTEVCLKSRSIAVCFSSPTQTHEK